MKKHNDLQNYKKLFPFFNYHPTIVYLDSAATALKPATVIEAITNYYKAETAHGGRSQFDLAYKINQKILSIRRKVANFINAADYQSILFTAGTTASINDCAYYFMQIKEECEIIIGRNEHSSNLFPWVKISQLNPLITIRFIDADKNLRYSLDQLKKVFTSKTMLVTINSISNAFGNMNDVEEIGAFVQNKRCIFVVDSTQSIAHIRADVTKYHCDFLAFSSHKMFGSTGTGVLYVNYANLKAKGFPKFHRFQTGGGSINSVKYQKQQHLVKFNLKESISGFESGTINYAGIIGLGAAVEFIEQLTYKQIKSIDHSLIKHFQSWVKTPRIAQFVTCYSKKPDIPLFTMNVKGVFCQDVASFLNEREICVRAGEHCVLLNQAMPAENKSIRISCSIYTDTNDLLRLYRAIEDLILEKQNESTNMIDHNFVRRQIIIDHYAHPQNKQLVTDTRYWQYYLKSDECIDEITIFMRYDQDAQKLVDIKFDGSACSICITACDLLIDLIRGLKRDAAILIIRNFQAMINNEDFDQSMVGELICLQNTYKVPVRIKCATLSIIILMRLFQKTFGN